MTKEMKPFKELTRPAQGMIQAMARTNHELQAYINGTGDWPFPEPEPPAPLATEEPAPKPRKKKKKAIFTRKATHSDETPAD